MTPGDTSPTHNGKHKDFAQQRYVSRSRAIPADCKCRHHNPCRFRFSKVKTPACHRCSFRIHAADEFPEPQTHTEREEGCNRTHMSDNSIFADSLPMSCIVYTRTCVCLCVPSHRTIEKLRTDNYKLKDELFLENKYSSLPSNSAVTTQISKLQDQADVFTRKIEIEKRRVAELDKQISKMNDRIMLQRTKMGGINAARENNLQIQKQIKILENRLEKALVKYNESIAHNKQLRESIDNLRRERIVFDQIYKKLEKELRRKEKEMSNIVEISNQAYEARDSALREMTQLKAQADREQAGFENELRELGKLIESDRRSKALAKQRDRTRVSEFKRGEMTLDEETKLKKQVAKGQWGIAVDKSVQKSIVEKVENYGEAFQKIQQATGISDIDELVNAFIDAEDQNFSLYNYVNELNAEVEKLEEQIKETKADIEKYKGQGASTDSQRKKILTDLETRLQKTESKADAYESKHSSALKTVNALKSGIFNIFNKIGCNTPAVSEMLGDQGITESNMMQYLGIIEQRTNEILQMYAASQAAMHGQDGAPGQGSALSSILGQGPQTAAGSLQISIEPPSTTDDTELDSSDDEQDEDRPLTREELKAKTMKNLSKREGGDKKKSKARKEALRRRADEG